MADKLTDDWPKHWTGVPTGMGGMARIDGKVYRFMGLAPNFPAMEQKSLEVTPTRTIYMFEQDGIGITLAFMSPLLPHDLDVLTRPVTYLTWDVKAVDGKSHDVQLYLEASGEWAVNSADQQVQSARHKLAGMRVLSIGSHDQSVLKRQGDGVRIDWGSFYVAAPGATDDVMSSDHDCRDAFNATGKLPESDDLRMPRAAMDNWPEMTFLYDLGKVGEATVTRHAMLAYDEVWATEFLQRKQRPYWRRNGMDIIGLLAAAEKDYPSLVGRCTEFDKQLTADLTKVGGKKYAELCALAYRQCLAGCGFSADFDGSLMMFAKENTSNGCIATVDVICPMSPFFLFFSPEMMKANLTPVMEYSRSARWKFPFAPHDLGTYPLANGQVYGGGERTEENQMPVEETGNMILMIAALAKVEGKADYADRYWPTLTKWAEYLREKGMDPENQLCTDDFMGHLAHNTNLSIKAILALDAYGMLADMTGRKAVGTEYHKLAKGMAAKWTEMASDGDHYRLAFDQPGTWSMKYNLAWGKVIGLNVFSPDVLRKEVAFYKTKMTKFGLPLDNRTTVTKTDSTIWAGMLTDSPSDFDAFVGPLYDFVNQSTKRVPIADVYRVDALDSAWLFARPVIGGVYMKMLGDPAMWKKWAK